MSMKRTCKNCRALNNGKCQLGYRTTPVKILFDVIVVHQKPMQPCPKPKNYKQLWKEIELRRDK